jgi:putative acetyltransferase
MIPPKDPKVEVEIVEFKPKYAKYFHDINVGWLEAYFEVEPYDRIVLEDPYGQIIAHGGQVFFAKVEGVVVGTCAIIKHTDLKYELAKMGVLEESRGLGVGRLLALAAIEKARILGATTLVLATSKKLEAANKLYRSLGFVTVDRSQIGPLPYHRESIVMALSL